MTQPAHPSAAVDPGLLRINEVAAETGLTTRAIRYYEEVGLLEPAARSEGDYRLYDASDLDRLRFIRDLRDDAGFSLAQIRQLLEDDAARERNRTRLRETADPSERRALLTDARVVSIIAIICRTGFAPETSRNPCRTLRSLSSTGLVLPDGCHMLLPTLTSSFSESGCDMPSA